MLEKHFFFFVLRMSAVSRSPAKEQQYKFGKYSSKASTRSEAYSFMVSSSGLSVGILRVAAFDLSQPFSQVCLFHGGGESTCCCLQTICASRHPTLNHRFYQVGEPLCEKEEGELFSRHFDDVFFSSDTARFFVRQEGNSPHQHVAMRQ